MFEFWVVYGQYIIDVPVSEIEPRLILLILIKIWPIYTVPPTTTLYPRSTYDLWKTGSSPTIFQPVEKLIQLTTTSQNGPDQPPLYFRPTYALPDQGQLIADPSIFPERERARVDRLSGVNGTLTTESRSITALSRSRKMDGSAMSGPWSGRAYVGLKYSADLLGPLWVVVVSVKVFQPDEKWSGMIPLSTGRMLSGGTAWWSAVQCRLVIFW